VPVGWNRYARHPMIVQPWAEIALSGREMMNVENLAIESEELTTHQAADSASEQTSEITPLALESFRFVGGGSIIVLG
jgi:hypothetical protein